MRTTMTPTQAKDIILNPAPHAHDTERYRIAWAVLTRSRGLDVDFSRLLRPGYHIVATGDANDQPCTAEDIRKRLQGRAAAIAAARRTANGARA